MPLTLGKLNDREWIQGAHPLEWKKVDPAFPFVARLRFEPGFADPHWCTASHVIHVESGALTLDLGGPDPADGELGERSVTLGRGEFIHLAQGTPHRAKNLGEVEVELLVVSQLERLERHSGS